MRSQAILLLLASSFLSQTPRLGATDCEAQQATFTALNTPLLVRPLEDARASPSLTANAAKTIEAYTPSLALTTATERLHAYVDEQILDRLNTYNNIQPIDLQNHLACLQRAVPEYGMIGDATNTPVVFSLNTGKPAIAVGFELFRGGMGVPSLRPYFEIFRKEQDKWMLAGSSGEDFIGATFNVHPIQTGKQGDDWFVLSGNMIGDSGSRLRVEIVGFDGISVRTIWGISGIPRGSVAEIARDHIVIAGDDHDARGHYLEYKKRLDVVPEGLKEVKVETSYPKPATKIP